VRHTQGYNTIYLPWEGFGWPNSLQPAPGEPALSWGEFFTNLSASGVERLRVKFCGWNGPLSTDNLSFEPTLGQFNGWGGRLEAMVDAAREHGVSFQVIPFDREEFMRGWAKHAWNSANGGFLFDPRDAFSAPQALDTAKARIDAIQTACGDTISCWELCAEMSFMITPKFWGVPNWGAMGPVVYDVLVPWVEEMALHVKSLSSAPVGNGNVFAPAGFDAGDAFRNEVYRTPSLDCAWLNWYGNEPVQEKLAFLRAAQAYIGKPVYVEQYAPWSTVPSAPYQREPADFSWSREHEWAAVCGEIDNVGPLRWPEIKPQDESRTWWGVASSQMAEIAGTTSAYAQVVKADEWAGRGEAWDSRVIGPVRYVSSWSDGHHVTAFVAWQTARSHDLRIEGLPDGGYTARFFDWIEGDLVDTVSAASVGEQMTLWGVPSRDGYSVLYISPQDAPPAPSTVTLRLSDPETGAVLETELEAGKTYHLEIVP
jgi:hypothetical protein